MKEKKVLIADFDEESLISLSNLIYEEGFQAVTVTDGLTAYEKFRVDNFDLVILEPMLPKLHGFELCKKINQDPAKKAPIVVVTGIYREPSCKVEALQVYGASAFFTKPWNKDELRSKILQLLVDKKDAPAKKKEEPVAPVFHVPERAKQVSPPKPVPRETKTSKGIDDIEKELQEAVSAFVGPSRIRETREKKETKDLNREIEAMLKGAIGELGREEKKKKPEAIRLETRPAPEFKAIRTETVAKPMAAVKPEPIPKIEQSLEKKEKIPVAREIKESFPFDDQKAGNNIPFSATRAFDREKIPFDIDKTLIEIDKIPFDGDKGPQKVERAQPEKDKAHLEKKKTVEEDAEPRKKRTTFLVIGALVTVVFLGSSATFYILKSKKGRPPQKQMVSSLTPSLPMEFSNRQEEIMPAQASRENETKPEPKKAQAKPAGQPESEVIDLQPVLPAESSPAQLQDSPLTNRDPSSQGNETAVEPAKNESEVQSKPEDAQIQSPAEPPAKEIVKVGSLVPLEKVTFLPVLIKRVEPKYPPRALRLAVEGVVTVNALISENGDVLRTEILKGVQGYAELEKAAETAIKQWKYRPAQKDGVNVKVWRPIEITFQLNQLPEKE